MAGRMIAFGVVERGKEEMRDSSPIPLLEEMLRDLRYAVRSLRASVGFTLVAVLTLAVGIGAGTAMFSVLNGVLLRALPVQHQDELVVLWTQAPARTASHLFVSYRDLTAFREQTRTLTNVAGVIYQGAIELVLLDAGSPVSLVATWVTGDFFPLLGVAPIHGRTLVPSDDVPGAAPVMVISYPFWQRHFSGEPSAVGHAFAWNGKLFTVVGVLPRGFEYPKGVQVWFPVIPAFPATVGAPADTSGIPMIFDLVGRLRPGANVRVARDDYDAFLRLGDGERPAADRGMKPVVTRLPDLIIGDAGAILWTASAAVGLLLLIACINVANLLLIRGSARSQELAIKSALGAGRRRLVRQLLIESGVLALVGGVLGLLLAIAAVRVLVALAPPELPRREMIEIDPGVLVFALGISGAAALLAGLLPAVLSAAGDLSVWLRGGRGTAGSRGAQSLRSGLVIGQISLAILVVMGAGLLTRSLIALESVDLGFNEDRLLVLKTDFPEHLMPEHSRQVALQEEMLLRVASLPGVIGATSMPKAPFSGQEGWIAMVEGEGQSPEAQATNPWLNFEVVGSGYFRTLEIPLLRGRVFGEQDRGDPPVAIISDAAARHFWPGKDALGKRLTWGGTEQPGKWMTVVGVVGETRYHDLRNPEPSLYVPTRQFGGPVPMTLAVRTRADPARVIPQIRRALQEVHPALMLARGGPMSQLLAGPLARPRFSTLLLGIFATITLLLAAVGIYGALAAMVRQRTREIGIRLGLGATVTEVRALVLRQGMRLALSGCALGIIGALLGTRVLRSMLFGVNPTDPVTFVAVVVVILLTAALACYLPARRATRVDPLVMLRAE